MIQYSRSIHIQTPNCSYNLATLWQVNSMVTGPDRVGQRLSFAEYYLCGAVTGGIASFVEGPMDLVSQSKINSPIKWCFKKPTTVSILLISLHFLILYQFKTKMQIQIIRSKSGDDVQYRNVFHAGADIYRNHGIKGCYQGLTATLLRNVPALGVYFSEYSCYTYNF